MILRLVESGGDWTLTICRSNKLLGVTQTANAVTLHLVQPGRPGVRAHTRTRLPAIYAPIGLIETTSRC